MKHLELELYLRKIANSGDSEIAYHLASHLRFIISDEKKVDELLELLKERVEKYEALNGVKLNP